MFEPVYKNSFSKDIEVVRKRGKDLKKFKAIFNLLIKGQKLPDKNRNHKLKGKYRGFWECHIEPDWLLIYDKTDTEIIFARTGTHSDLF